MTSDPSPPGIGPDALLERLTQLGEAIGTRGLGAAAEAERSSPGLASFFRYTRAREPRTEPRALDSPWLALVLSGSMAVHHDRRATRAEVGEVVILPGRTPLEVTLSPASATAFESLEVELLAESRVRRSPIDLALGDGAGVSVIQRPGRAALTALVGFCEGVLEPTTHPRLLEHQLEGVLLALVLEDRGDPASRERDRAQLDLTLAIRQIVRATPERPWSLPGMARRLGLSQATLRRRLAQRGTGLRRLVQEERMLVARTLLGDGRLNVTEVATRCGYGSPAKFSRQFKHAFGIVPSQYRQGESRPELH
jgi:AraC-like DNA-binding protein